MLASHGLRERERETRNSRAEAKTKERRCAPETQEEGKTRTHHFRDAFRVRVRVTMMVSYWTLTKM
jgi:hypothetical protein